MKGRGCYAGTERIREEDYRKIASILIAGRDAPYSVNIGDTTYRLRVSGGKPKWVDPSKNLEAPKRIQKMLYDKVSIEREKFEAVFSYEKKKGAKK